MPKNKKSDKEVYNEKICKYCKYYNECSKNLFNVYVLKDRTSYRCSKYEYKDFIY